jgi:hypothetical protein
MDIKSYKDIWREAITSGDKGLTIYGKPNKLLSLRLMLYKYRRGEVDKDTTFGTEMMRRSIYIESDHLWIGMNKVDLAEFKFELGK